MGGRAPRLIWSPVRCARGDPRRASRRRSALATFDVTGYARVAMRCGRRTRQGAIRLSPYIRHGLLDLPRVWQHVEDGPAKDVGDIPQRIPVAGVRPSSVCPRRPCDAAIAAIRRSGAIRDAPIRGRADTVPRIEGMACIDMSRDELHRTGLADESAAHVAGFPALGARGVGLARWRG